MNFRHVSFVACALVIGAPAIFATPVPLAPGGTVTTFTPTTSSFTGTLVDTYSGTFSNAFENGTVSEDVYLNGGMYDFYYKVTNNSSSIDSLTRVTVGNYTGYTTSVDYLLNGGDAPSAATRQAAGDSVGFYDPIAPGTSSDWLEVATDATSYNNSGTIALIDSISTNFSSPGPATAPEPLSLGLISSGLLAIGVARWRRSEKNS